MRRLVWFVLVLAVLVVGADRGGAYAAERVVASGLQSSEVLDTEPDVDIAGIPFLTQFAAASYPKVVVTVNDVTVKDTDLRIDRVRVTFDDVRANRDFTRFDAENGTAVATVGYGTLRQALDTEVAYAGGGRVRVTRSVTVLGTKIAIAVTAKPRVAGGVLTLVDPELVKKLPSGVSLDLSQAVRVRIPVSGLPFDLKVRGVSAAADGVRLTLSGTNLSYVR